MRLEQSGQSVGLLSVHGPGSARDRPLVHISVKCFMPEMLVRDILSLRRRPEVLCLEHWQVVLNRRERKVEVMQQRPPLLVKFSSADCGSRQVILQGTANGPQHVAIAALDAALKLESHESWRSRDDALGFRGSLFVRTLHPTERPASQLLGSWAESTLEGVAALEPGLLEAVDDSGNIHAMKQDTLERLARLADHGDERRAVWQEAAELIRRAGDYRWVGLYEVTDTEIGAIAWTGTVAPAFPRFPRDEGLNGVAVNTRDAVISQDVANDPRYLAAFADDWRRGDLPCARGFRLAIGTIDVECDRPNAFSPEDEHFLRSCSIALKGLWRTLPEELPT